MRERILGLAIYWGIWLILPVLVDGLTTLVQLVQVALRQLLSRRRAVPELLSPKGVSIIIPVYNGEQTLGNCLHSLRTQAYPHELIEVIVVDNGSTD
ncbi:MAG: glycosyltransferase, partial [Anaerolineae bacterium]|nr:glycosyltransferase [Anaerolineae bacterium]